MANIKKYNPETQSWETWASSSATGVYSVNPELLPEDEQAITVEDALVRDREDIELMKKNISWLALHGGGGPGGGGGGGSDTEVTNTIEVYDINGNVSTNLIWRSSYNSISYRVFSSKASNKFNISVALDGRVIDTQKGIDSNRQMSVKINNLKSTANNKHTMRIVAVDLYDNMISTNVEITELSLSVFGTNANNIYTVDINEVLSNGTLSVNCKSSIVGDYILYWGTSSDIETNLLSRKGQTEVSILNPAFNYQVSVPYWAEERENRLLETNTGIGVGQSLMFYFLLVNKNDESIKSEPLEIVSTVVSPDNLAIKPLSLSPDITEITKISKAGVLNCNFIVYLNADSFQYNYRVTVYKLQQNSSTLEWERGDAYPNIFYSGTGKYKETTALMYNNLHTDEFFEGGARYEFVIYAEDRMNPTKYGQISTYVEIQFASDIEIDLGPEVNRSKIFDFNIRKKIADETTWEWAYQNDEFYHGNSTKAINTTANFFNMGGKSKREITHYRLTNKAHMIINQSSLDGQPVSWFPSNTSSADSGLISASGPQFTLSIRYFNDYTPDDDRTIFNFGNYIPQTATDVASGQGILINNHDFYVKIGSGSNLVTGKIQDSIYHAIDIVVGRNNNSTDGNTTVEVYHNGVLLSFGKQIRVSDIYTLSRYNEMSVACNKRNGTISQYTNIKLQGVSLYARALDPYQIVCNYINNLVTWELNANNELNSELLNEKLAANLILKDNDDNYSCPIWNYGEFDTHQWIDDNFGQLRPKQALLNVCPIPIVILDFSNVAEWEWDVFTESWEDKTMPGVQVPMYYFQPYNTGEILSGEPVTVSIQGTTSKSYAIKNLNIDFGEDRMFWAKQNWFPERVYTLKADIVDSAHANNACIGRFVNACAQNTQLLEPTPPMRYFNSNKNLAEFSDLPLSALAEGGVTVKHTLEGFPILLLARFVERGSISNRSLGIYSFNLGREAYHNMGFELLKKFRYPNQSILGSDEKAPMLLGRPNRAEDVITFNAESWEGKESLNCTPKTANTKTQIDAQTNGGYDSSVNAVAPVQLDGYFWSSYQGHIDRFWGAKYPEGGTTVDRFQQLCRDLVACPYVKGNFDTGDRGNVYQYDWDGTQMVVPDQTTGAHKLDRLNKKCPFNVKNAAFYYVICMLFGLVDSLGKNLNMRIWNKEDPDSQWYTCFYDMDTALGIDNIGTEKVDPDVLDESLTNNPELNQNFIISNPTTLIDNRKMYTVKDNKLWGIIDHRVFGDQFVGNAVEGSDSLYANAWNIIRTNYLKSVDDFMNIYFTNQTEGVGELLYNQDFDTKYLGTPQFTFMYGDRKAFVRYWITKRIKFLDSYFGYLQKVKGSSSSYLESVNIEDCSYKNKIVVVHQSGDDYLPVTSSTPCILTSTIGNESNKYNYYLPANTPVPVRFANALGTPGIQTWVNNSDLLLKIQYLSSLKVSKIAAMQTSSIPGAIGDELYSKQLGTLSSFTDFNVAGNRKFDNDGIDFIKLFKTWNNGPKTLPYSLTSLDLSDTKNSYITKFPLDLTSDIVNPNGGNYYANPFENLTDINIMNSCVTGVRLPENIALNTLQIAGSAVEDITLIGQSILKTVDFSNCTALKSINLDNCSAFETLVAENLPSLEEITVSGCPKLTEIKIDLNGSTYPVRINIDEVPSLKKLSILNAYSPDCSVSVIASGLEELVLTGCKFESIQLQEVSKETLKLVDIGSSSVKLINWNGTFTGDYLDLWGCDALVAGGINIANNKVIEKVQLPNIDGSPVKINFSFSGCTNLTRIYGNLNLTQTEMFNNCTKFTVHGGKFKQSSSGTPVNVIQNGVQLYLTDGAAVSGKCLTDIFQEGREVTNLTVNVANASKMFRNTAVDAFDVYYILRHLNTNVTNISHMFEDCPNIKMKITSTVDNSPHWTMFSKCGNVTNVSYLFANDSAMGPFRVYGNHTGESNESWAHDGLFTPLSKCKNFYKVFGSTTSNGNIWFITDRNTFTLKTEGTYFGGKTGTANLGDFSPKDVYVNLNKMSTADVYKAYSTPNDTTLNSSYERGNIKDFFKCFYLLPAELSNVMNGLRYLNFGSRTEDEESPTMSKLPLEVTSVENCFSAARTAGIAKLQRLFTRNPETNTFDVVSISSSFDDNDATVANATWELDDSTLEGFTKLNVISHTFDNLTKVILGSTFPYHIFDPCASRIGYVTNFFNGARHNQGLIESVDLPGDLFKRCTNLQGIGGCFANFNIPFYLTSNGFINCPRLSNVNSLFSGTKTNLNSLPRNFFNIGFTEQTDTIVGADISQFELELPENSTGGWLANNDYEIITTNGDQRITRDYRYVEEENGTVICTPLSKYFEKIETLVNGQWKVTSSWSDLIPVREYSEWQPREIEVPKRVPKRSIKNMSSVFADSNILRDRSFDTNDGLDFHDYRQGGDVEPNPDYCPFEYIYQNGDWVKATMDLRPYTFMWSFDGVWYQRIKELENLSDYVLDDKPVGDRFSGGTTSNFLCPPDLLRWCTTNPDLTNLFLHSGFRGRLPAYLLKPVSGLTSAKQMFTNSGTIVAYVTEEKPDEFICIPPSFFSYTPNVTDLTSTFSHTTLRANPLIFEPLKNNKLIVDNIFYGAHWVLPTGTQSGNNKFELFDVFANNRIDSCKNAFDGSYSESSQKQYISFSNMFSKDNAKHPSSADGRVFYGYYSSAYVTHESAGNRTCGRNDPTDSQQNYKYLH